MNDTKRNKGKKSQNARSEEDTMLFNKYENKFEGKSGEGVQSKVAEDREPGDDEQR